MRIGLGYDAHKFQEGGKLVLGGVHIPYHKSLKAHSDGDVLIHALCDALLGAAGMGDIGRHFPDNEDKYKNINSRELLRHVVIILDDKKLQVSNTDITVIAQAPRMSPYINEMQSNLSDDLVIDLDHINIKATTTEGMGFTGREEGIAVHVVALLKEI